MQPQGYNGSLTPSSLPCFSLWPASPGEATSFTSLLPSTHNSSPHDLENTRMPLCYVSKSLILYRDLITPTQYHHRHFSYSSG